MPTLLDGVTEAHDGPEPKVVASDVQAVLRAVVRPGSDDGVAVSAIAERAGVSTRTIYRVLDDKDPKPTLNLDLADRICLACGTHIAFSCSLIWPDGSITDYTAQRTA